MTKRKMTLLQASFYIYYSQLTSIVTKPLIDLANQNAFWSGLNDIEVDEKMVYTDTTERDTGFRK